MPTQLLIDSHYYRYWYEFSSWKASAKTACTSQFKKFENYLIIRGHGDCELDFERFYYYTESNDYEPIDQKFITQYLEHLEQQENTTKFVLYNNIVYLKHFFSVLFNARVISVNPMAHFRNPYYERKIIDRALSIEECRAILETAKRSDPFMKMHYILCLTMMTTGLRNSEIVQLTFPQVDFERNVIHVNKGQKTTAEVVYIPTVVAQLLKEYFSHPGYREWIRNGNDHVFFNQNKPFNQHSLLHFIKKNARDSGIPKHVTPHCYRHTTAYLMQLNGISVSVIRRQLRHKSIATTLRYLPPAPMVREALEQFAESIMVGKDNDSYATQFASDEN